MSQTASTEPGRHWTSYMTKYHWYVFALAALGWLFDTMDGMIFTASRSITINDLMKDASPDDRGLYGGIVTSLFILGWATGGLIFGVVGDRWGRAKTMALTIFIYAAFTGLSGLSTNWWHFALFRFLTGLGVGGEFAAGAALLSEVMPEQARAKTLGWLQALSAVGNMIGAAIFWYIEPVWGWKALYFIGAFPALLSVVVRAGLKEPEKWQAAKDAAMKNPGAAAQGKQMGGIQQLFAGELRRKTCVGLSLGIAGVLGLWGAGFFSAELMDTSFAVISTDSRAKFEKLLAAKDKDEQLAVLGKINAKSKAYSAIVTSEFEKDLAIDAKKVFTTPLSDKQAQRLKTILDSNSTIKPDLAALLAAELEVSKDGQVTKTTVRDELGKVLTAKDEAEQKKIIFALDEEPTLYRNIVSRRFTPDSVIKPDDAFTTALTSNQTAELKVILEKSMPKAEHTSLKAKGLILQQIGAFFGIMVYGFLAGSMGRKPAFVFAFAVAWFSVVYTFLFFNERSQVWYLYPLLGFGTLAPFGGYALYFPELFPTRLRTTGTGFCYNVGRYVSSFGPFALPLFAAKLHGTTSFAGFRMAAAVISCAYLIGLIALIWAPETKDQPLPDDERGFTH